MKNNDELEVLPEERLINQKRREERLQCTEELFAQNRIKIKYINLFYQGKIDIDDMPNMTLMKKKNMLSDMIMYNERSLNRLALTPIVSKSDRERKLLKMRKSFTIDNLQTTNQWLKGLLAKVMREIE